MTGRLSFLFFAVPLAGDLPSLRAFLEGNRPYTNPIYYTLFGRVGPGPRWVRLDDREDPHAVLVRTRRFTLFATDTAPVRRVIAEVPRNYRMRFGATPTRFYRTIRQSWHGRDRGRRTRHDFCFMYCLEPGRLALYRKHRVWPLKPADAGLIARYWPYGRSVAYVEARIAALPSCGIRRGGRLVAWALTHDDGSMGFLHVLDEFRGQGMARSLTTALAQRLVGIGIQPFLYIVKSNTASMRLTESMGFSRHGEYAWFGTG